MPESFAEGLVGVVLDERYRLDALLGEGGMGAVYRAHHLAMDRRVAVKLLKPHLTGDEVMLQRFAREARSTMKVDSEHAVKVLDFGITPHRDYYMVLEYLDGRTVQQELDVDGPFSPARTVHVAKQSLRALAAAHARGLVHRDIKPDNILLMRQGDDPDFAKVLDFGVAKLMEGSATSDKSALSITQAGMVFGTPEFMSPEQACGQPLDPRSDLYSLAATMFAMLTGYGLFRAKTPLEWLTSHVRTPPPRLMEAVPSLSPYRALDKVLQRCLAKKREERPEDALAMIALLESVEGTLDTTPTSPTRPARPTAVPAPGSGAARIAVSPSTYTPSIAADDTLPPGPSPSGATTSGVMSQLHGSRRGLWLALGGSAILATVVTAAIVAGKRKHRGSAMAAANPAELATGLPADAGTLPPPQDAIGAPDARPLVDAGVRAVAQTGSGRPRGSPELAAHLAAAEQAHAAGNHLRQLAEADAALQLEPRNARARFLAGDALIASGDLDRGCKYLRDLGTNPTALQRARQAGCPTH